MPPKHTDLNKQRKESYRKPPEDERFLETFNEELLELERSLYSKQEPEFPFLFVIGLPRSGTTLLSQLIAHCLDVGFVNNLAARFWKAPVTGIRFARSVLGVTPIRGFESHYGATDKLRDIHEFGYFWREWLLKDSFENIKNAHLIEDRIDWKGLRTTLANIQAEFNRPMILKNIFGSYHIPKLNQLLKKVHWIYIERDPLDTAVSILQARQQYYDDPNTWWSYVPPDYEKIISLDYRRQIAGQIHYLKAYYRHQMEESGKDWFTVVSYADLCQNPESILDNITSKIFSRFGHKIGVVQDPPAQFELRTYENRKSEKDQFKQLLAEFSQND